MILNSLGNIFYDYIVVGSGPAGQTFAQKIHDLSQGKKRTLIIESGDLEGTLVGKALAEVEASGDLNSTYYPVHNQRRLGGTSMVWSGYCATLEKRPFLTGEWPIEYEELAAYYPQAAEILGVSADVHDIAETTFAQNPNVIYRPYHLSPPTRFGSKSFLDRLARSRSVDIVFNKTVTNLSIQDGVINAVNLADSKTATKSRIEMKRNNRLTSIVLACGGIQNARLLQLSRLANSPALGKGFSEHPHIYHQCHLAITSDSWDKVQQSDYPGLIHAIGLSSPFLVKSSKKCITLQIPKVEKIKTQIHGEMKTCYAGKAVIRTEMDVDQSNFITLASGNDAINQAQARVSLSFNKQQLSALVKTFALEIAKCGIGRLTFLPEDFSVTGGGHMMATTKMGTNPQTSVVDINQQIHGVSNGYVAGSSIFPAVSAANPTLSIVALSLRLATHLMGSKYE
jgi:hypothetical protein